MFRFIGLVSMIAIVAIMIAGFHDSAAQTNKNTVDNYPWPDGQGKAIVKKSCLACHGSDVIVKKPGRTTDQWTDVLSTMVGRGAVISDDDTDTLIQYLATNFGPDAKNAPPASDQTAPPEGSNGAVHTASSDTSAPVNVNKASVDELTSALGLTHAEADLIVGHREQYGNFKTWQDITAISGVPADKIKENQKRLVF